VLLWGGQKPTQNERLSETGFYPLCAQTLTPRRDHSTLKPKIKNARLFGVCFPPQRPKDPPGPPGAPLLLFQNYPPDSRELFKPGRKNKSSQIQSGPDHKPSTPTFGKKSPLGGCGVWFVKKKDPAPHLGFGGGKKNKPEFFAKTLDATQMPPPPPTQKKRKICTIPGPRGLLQTTKRAGNQALWAKHPHCLPGGGPQTRPPENPPTPNRYWGGTKQKKPRVRKRKKKKRKKKKNKPFPPTKTSHKEHHPIPSPKKGKPPLWGGGGVFGFCGTNPPPHGQNQKKNPPVWKTFFWGGFLKTWGGPVCVLGNTRQGFFLGGPNPF